GHQETARWLVGQVGRYLRTPLSGAGAGGSGGAQNDHIALTLVVPARAKLNLDLRVLGRREDGFHELHTTFQAIDLHDLIDVQHAVHTRDEVECVGLDPQHTRGTRSRASTWPRKTPPSSRPTKPSSRRCKKI